MAVFPIQMGGVLLKTMSLQNPLERDHSAQQTVWEAGHCQHKTFYFIYFFHRTYIWLQEERWWHNCFFSYLGPIKLFIWE